MGRMPAAELGRALGVSKQAAASWLRGTVPDVATVVRIAQHLGVTVDELISEVSS